MVELADIPKMKVTDLKAALTELSLSTNGLKAELATRLTEAVNGSPFPSSGESPANEPINEAEKMNEEEKMDDKTSATEAGEELEQEKEVSEEEEAAVTQRQAEQRILAAKAEQVRAEQAAARTEQAATRATVAKAKEAAPAAVAAAAFKAKVIAAADEKGYTVVVKTNGSNGVKEKTNSKRALKRAKAKQQKKALKEQDAETKKKLEEAAKQEEREAARARRMNMVPANDASLVEYVGSQDLHSRMPGYEQFKEIFGKFATPEELTAEKKKSELEEDEAEEAKEEQFVEAVVEKKDDEKGLSKKAKRLASRLSIAELKQLVARPEIVEFHDCNSSDPKLLVWLKAYRNTVPVPAHWCQKRKFLQGKRGFEKPPFELPKFIADTGISDIRQAQLEREDAKKAKTKAREKTQPKTGKIDIDYHVLHDAFFTHQTKPKMTSFGMLYYEGREFEVKLKSKRPGNMSEELKRSLGMTEATTPPPWLFNMQRFGPPPSYPMLKIPGVNTPIPPGARYGFGPGEWGKPPVDEYGRPLYGDVFGTELKADADVDTVNKAQWAQLQDEDEDEDEDEDDEEEEENEDDEDDMESGMESVSSMTSGLETPEKLNLRKGNDNASEDSSEVRPKALYTVLEEKKSNVGGALFGSQHTYVIPTATMQSEMEKRVRDKQTKQQQGVNVNLNPEELENLDAMTLKRKYEAQLEAESVAKKPQVDVSDVADTREKKKAKTDKKKFKF